MPFVVAPLKFVNGLWPGVFHLSSPVSLPCAVAAHATPARASAASTTPKIVTNFFILGDLLRSRGYGRTAPGGGAWPQLFAVATNLFAAVAQTGLLDAAESLLNFHFSR